MKKIIAKGITKVKEIIEEIKKHFFPGEVNVIVCEEVLADNVCKALREAAKILKVKVEEIDAAVREALDKGITKAKDIIKFVRAKIESFVHDFKCEQVLDEGICAKIHEIAALIKVDAAKVDAFIRDLVVKGITKAKEIIEEIKKHFFPGVEGELINVITCEDVLSADMCKKLRDAAEMFKIKAAEVDKMIREAIAKGVTKAKEIFKIVQAKLIEMAKNFKCTDALSKDICDKIAEVAAKLKVKMAEVMKVMKKIIAKGITKVKEIIEEIKKHFFPGEVNVIVCEEVLADNVCKALREAAKILKVKVEEIDAAVREALDKGLTKAKDIIKFVRAKIESFVHDFKCERVLDEGICAKIHEIAALIKVDAAKVDAFIRDLVVKGITKAKEIIEEIKKHFFPGVEGELINVITCEDVLSADMCKKLRDAAEMFKIKAAEVDKIIREAIAKGVTKAKEIFKIV